jgi:hypothetical protein
LGAVSQGACVHDAGRQQSPGCRFCNNWIASHCIWRNYFSILRSLSREIPGRPAGTEFALSLGEMDGHDDNDGGSTQ